ncbi:MAG TPA: YcgN family cysteine cluster protein [Rhodobiaceae bacterium]|nr:YcgN family cysteine cluster protein [Rhodobiaceae bacterium]|tara:strand:- start:568 stop:1014 length:447 start_codon:yes stop_codon:yes gene_type:complete
MAEKLFWQTVKLADMTAAQWEAVCDGCAKCCLVKLQDEGSDETVFTDIVCNLLDQQSCRCSHYEERTKLVPDCVKLTKDNLDKIDFMPPSCAYRLLHEGKDLPPWHPLVSGRADSVVEAGMSVKGRVIAEMAFDGDSEDRVVDWPLCN